jgi:hypothetical protein
VSFSLDDLPRTEDGQFARMPIGKDMNYFNQGNDDKPQYTPVSELDLWFMGLLDEREQAVIEQAYHYQAMNAPGLPGHLYLTTIHKLAEILAQVDVEFEAE